MNAWFDILGLTPTSKEDEEGIKKSSQICMIKLLIEVINFYLFYFCVEYMASIACSFSSRAC